MFPRDVGTLKLYAGDDFSVTLRFAEGGVSVDLTAWSDWRADWRAGKIEESFTVDDSRLTEGIITLTLTGEQTRTMKTHGSWDIQAKNNTLTRTWARGTTSRMEDVTRP